MSHHIGLKAFTEVSDYFKLFASREHQVETKQCKSLISGGWNVQVNYIYDVKLNDLNALTNDIELIKATRFPMMLLCAIDGNTSLNTYFQHLGFTLIGSAQSKMKDITDFSYTLSSQISIAPVTTPLLLHTWREIAALSFEYPLGCDDGLFDTFLEPGLHHDHVKFFVAYLDGKAVGQCMLVLGKNASINMWSSVLPEYRKRGVLTEMIRYRNLWAKNLGYKTSIVQCMDSSAPIYDKLGYTNAEIFNLYAVNT